MGRQEIKRREIQVMKVDDAVLSLNNFNTPKIIQGYESINMKIIRLILYEPGTSPDFPDKGVGLISKYRYLTQNNLNELMDRIKDQINTYLPEFNGVDVQLEIYKGILNIGISIDNVLYEYSYDGEIIKNRTTHDLQNIR